MLITRTRKGIKLKVLKEYELKLEDLAKWNRIRIEINHGRRISLLDAI